MEGLTIDLSLEPFESCSGELLFRRAIVESVGDSDLGEVFKDGALHGQFVEIGIEEGDDPLGERRGAVEVHYAERVLPVW